MTCSLTIPLPQPLVYVEEVPYDTNKPSTKRMKESLARSAIQKGVLEVLRNDGRQQAGLIPTQRAAPYVPVASSSALPPSIRPATPPAPHLFENVSNPVGKIMEALQASGKSTNTISFTSTQETVMSGMLFLSVLTQADV